MVKLAPSLKQCFAVFLLRTWVVVVQLNVAVWTSGAVFSECIHVLFSKNKVRLEVRVLPNSL